MKITKEEYTKHKDLIRLILSGSFLSTDGSIVPFLPIDMTEEITTDEFGMATRQYKADTFYGNSLLLGMTYEDIPAYAQSTNVFTFDLTKFYSLVELNDDMLISDDDKEELAELAQYEWCLVDSKHLFKLHL